MSQTFDNLINLIQQGDRQYDIEKIRHAYDIANTAHGDQQRKSGQPYISHPIAVACLLVQLGMDTDSLCAALLHDVAEDTSVSLEEINRLFGETIMNLVDGVTKLGKLPLASQEEQQAENVRKMLLAMARDIRVIIIKLADRLHNMRTLSYLETDRQLAISLETIEVYAPIAHRLGIRMIKEELEDLAISYLDPIAYNEIEDILKRTTLDSHGFLEQKIEDIKQRLSDFKLSPHIEGRVKNRYGIFRKVYMAGRAFEEVYDIFAVRIIADTVIECYNILGIIHEMFTPIPGRFKDYISTPKTNMYQSLHTTVISKEQMPFEIQIRTWDMNYTAEYGIAAHWKYKSGISGKDKLDERLTWIRQIIEAQQESENIEELVQSIKTDIGSEEVFVYTPKGDVKSLPVGSSVVDFAYAIHSAVGNKMTGAKIDGRIVPLDTKVKTGQIVEIITTNSQNHMPNREWIKFAKTSEARNKIRSWFKRERREENIIAGKIELEYEFKRNMIQYSEAEMTEAVADLARRQKFNNVEDFYAAIGYGGIMLSKIMPRIKDEYIKLIKQKEPNLEDILATVPHRETSKSAVIVEGIDNCLIRFSQCCNPLPGDEITGFITRGHGVSIHKQGCNNVIATRKDPLQTGRFIRVSWADNIPVQYRSTLDIIANGSTNLLVDISMALASFKVPIHELTAREIKNGNTNIVTTIGILGIEQLNSIINKLQKVKGVISVERTGK